MSKSKVILELAGDVHADQKPAVVGRYERRSALTHPGTRFELRENETFVDDISCARHTVVDGRLKKAAKLGSDAFAYDTHIIFGRDIFFRPRPIEYLDAAQRLAQCLQIFDDRNLGIVAQSGAVPEPAFDVDGVPEVQSAAGEIDGRAEDIVGVENLSIS